MAAPGHHVHRTHRRVGELDEEDALAGEVGDAVGVVAEGQGVETVEDQAERGVRGTFDDVPGLAPEAGVAAPGERLEADAQAAPVGPLGHLAQVGGGARRVVEGGRLGVAADQDHLGAELLHDVELALGALEIAGALRLGHRLEVAERLVEVD
jgi:hypothetical protein